MPLERTRMKVRVNIYAVLQGEKPGIGQVYANVVGSYYAYFALRPDAYLGHPHLGCPP